MRTVIRPFIAAAILAISGAAFGQNHADANATVDATVVCPIKIVKKSNLDFGTVVSGTGTAHVTNSGAISYTGNVFAFAHSGTHNAAAFNVTGESGFSYVVTRTPSSGSLVVTDGSGHTATVQLDAPVAASGTLGTLTSCSSGSGSSGDDDTIDHGNDGHGNSIGNNGNDNGNHGQGNNGNGGDDEDDDDGGSTGSGCCGAQTFNVGGVLSIVTGQVPGYYSNSHTGGTPWFETVTYN